MTLFIKPGVVFKDLSTPMVAALGIVHDCLHVLGYDCVITSGADSKHTVNSKHYARPMQALDFRTKHLSPEHKDSFYRMVAFRLGLDYDVILESKGKPNEHLHVEWDPKPTNQKKDNF